MGHRARHRGELAAHGLATGLALLIGCGSGSIGEIRPHPLVDELGLNEAERAAYSPMEFDKFSEAIEIASDDADAVEMVIKRVNHKTIGWSGVVQSTRIVKHGAEISEFSLSVSPPSQAGVLFPKTFPVLIEAPNGDPVTQLPKGTPVVFVGRLEFDGLSREAWVMDARLLDR